MAKVFGRRPERLGTAAARQPRPGRVGTVGVEPRGDRPAHRLERQPPRRRLDRPEVDAVRRSRADQALELAADRDRRALESFECGHPVELVLGDCHAWLAEFPFDGSELVYSDPPYLRSVRKSSRRYRHDYEDADHVALLDLLKGLPCAAMVSGYPSALYDESLRGWRSASLQVMNRAGVVTEKVWFNFAPDRVHWASRAGRDFTHRQTVKRKAAGWGRRYRAMPPAERLAVLAAVMAVEAEP
ncbi:MAG: DNA methylase [Gammaproteobacteria bacterium]|nr:DNA methylase [Gammaproteobacteria bacterium]